MTGHVSPQWHCVFDDLFSTVVSPSGMIDQRFNADKWTKLLSTGHEQYAEEKYDEDGDPIPLPPLAPEWNSLPTPSVASRSSSHVTKTRLKPPKPPPTLTETIDELLDALRESITPSSGSEGASVQPPPPAPEGEDDKDNDFDLDQAVEDVPSEQPPPAPDPDEDSRAPLTRMSQPRLPRYDNHVEPAVRTIESLVLNGRTQPVPAATTPVETAHECFKRLFPDEPRLESRRLADAREPPTPHGVAHEDAHRPVLEYGRVDASHDAWFLRERVRYSKLDRSDERAEQTRL
jgi:hypothetical protein